MYGRSTSWKDLNELVQSFQAKGSSHMIPALRPLLSILEQLRIRSRFRPEQESLRQALREVMVRLNNSTAPVSDQALGESMLDRLHGPLVRRFVQQKYSIEEKSGDWPALAHDLNSGLLDKPLLLGNIQSFLSRPVRKSSKAKYDLKKTGDRLPIDDQEPELELALDPNEYKNFFRDGPFEMDLERLEKGELLAWTFRESEPIRKPLINHESTVSVVMVDTSESTSRHQIRDVLHLLKMAYLERAQAESAADNSDHQVIVIPFTEVLGEPVYIRNLAEAHQYFSDNINSVPRADEGNNFDQNIIDAYDYIIKHKEKNPKLKKANLLFLTDGGDNFDVQKIIEKRKTLPNDIDLSFRTINVFFGNEQFEVTASNGTGRQAFGNFSYSYIPPKEFSNILNANVIRNAIERQAQMTVAGTRLISNPDINRLLGALRNIHTQELDYGRFDRIIQTLRGQIQSNGQNTAQTASQHDKIADQIMLFEPSSELPLQVRLAQKMRLIEALSQIEVGGVPTDMLLSLSPQKTKQLLDWFEDKKGK